VGRAVPIRTRREGDDAHRVLAVDGELDITTAPVLEREVNRCAVDGTEEIVIDLRDVAFIDSSGLRSLVVAKRMCDRRHVKLSLRDPSAHARRILDLTGLNRLFVVDEPVGC
jgi:anti-anti-sigma factor